MDGVDAFLRRYPDSPIVLDVLGTLDAVGHTDWSAKHVRFDEALRLTALYDWDSVTTDFEPVLVGTAAGSFTYTEELEHPIDVWPAADESLSFIEEYERERGELTRAEHHAALAACVYLRAYATRCRHAQATRATRASPSSPTRSSAESSG